MIFGDFKLEKFVQVNDKTRIDCTKSFVSKDSAAITLVEIEPYAGAGFIDVTGSSSKDWFLDWEYSTDGTKAVTLRITTDGAPVAFSESIEILTEVNDGLLSNDSDLTVHEPDILKYIRAGRNSYLDYHRRSRDLILDWLDENNWTDVNGARLTKTNLVAKEQFRKWSTYMTLSLIYDGISNAIDDIFKSKSKDYDKRANAARDRGEWKIDLNNDSEQGNFEGVTVQSVRMYRR